MGLKDFIRKFVAQSEFEISQKPIDIYTISHFITGIIAYLCLFPILEPIFSYESKYISLIIVLIWGVLWEYIENFMLSKTRLKINKTKDSLRNSLTDIVANGIGGIVTFFSPIIGGVILGWLIFVGIYGWVKKSVKK